MNVSELTEFVKFGLMPTHTLCLEGDHGIGKTSYVMYTMKKAIAERYGVSEDRVHVITRCASQLDPSDLIGNFTEVNGRSYNNPPFWIPTAKSYDDRMTKIFASAGKQYTSCTEYDDFYILFIDEYLRGQPTIHNALMEVTLGHTVFGVPFHENTFVVCADNANLDIYNGNARVDPAQRSRIKSTVYAPTDDEHLGFLKEFARTGRISDIIIEYLLLHKEYIKPSSDTIRDLYEKGEKTASPRDWTQLGESILNAQIHGLDYVGDAATSPEKANKLNEIASMYVGVLGPGFSSYCADRQGLGVDIERLFKSEADNYEEWKKIGQLQKLSIPVMAYNAARAVEKLDSSKPHIGKNILKFINSLPQEFSAEGTMSFWSDWKAAQPTEAASWLRYSGARQNAIYKNLGGYKDWKARQIANGVNLDSDEPIIRK